MLIFSKYFKIFKRAIFIFSGLLFFILIFCFLNIYFVKNSDNLVYASCWCSEVCSETCCGEVCSNGECQYMCDACGSYCCQEDCGTGTDPGTDPGNGDPPPSCPVCLGGENCAINICNTNPGVSCGNPCLGGTNCTTNLCGSNNSVNHSACNGSTCAGTAPKCSGDNLYSCNFKCVTGQCIEDNCTKVADCGTLGGCRSGEMYCSSTVVPGSQEGTANVSPGGDWMVDRTDCGRCIDAGCVNVNYAEVFIHCAAQDSEIDQGCINGLNCVWTVHMPGQCASFGNCGQTCAGGTCGSSAGSCGTGEDGSPNCTGGNAQNTCTMMPGQCAMGEVTIECSHCNGGLGGDDNSAGPLQCNSSYQCIRNGGGASCVDNGDCLSGGGGGTKLPKRCNTTTFQCVPGGNGPVCVSDQDCLFKYQQIKTQCNKDKMCAPLGGGKDCTTDEECQEPIPLTCDAQVLQCIPGGETNQSCTSNSNCSSNLCDRSNGKCYGDICTTSDDCKPHCNMDKCDPATKSGRDCTTNADCAYRCNSDGATTGNWTCSQDNNGRICNPTESVDQCWHGCNAQSQCVWQLSGKACTDSTDCNGGTWPYICVGKTCVDNRHDQVVSDRPCDAAGDDSKCAYRCTPDLKCDPYGNGAICNTDTDCIYKCDPNLRKCIQGVGSNTTYTDCDHTQSDAQCEYNCDTWTSQCKLGGNGKKCDYTLIDSGSPDCVYKCNSSLQCEQGASGRLCTASSGDSDCKFRCNAEGTKCIQGRDHGGIGAECSTDSECVPRCTTNNKCEAGGSSATGKLCNLSRGDVDCVPICNMAGQCSGRTWLPVAGDWNGDGKTTIGIYDITTSIFLIRNYNDEGPAENIFHFGTTPGVNQVLNPAFTGSLPSKVGIYNYNDASFRYAESNSNDAGAIIYNTNGMAGNTPVETNWQPITGNWHRANCPVALSFGLYDPETSVFYMYSNRVMPVYGLATDCSPQSFSFDYSFGYGEPNKGWYPITGDWDGNGSITVGLYDPVASMFYLKNSNDSSNSGTADITFGFGAPNNGWIPITGDWEGDGHTSVGLYDPITSVYYLRYTNTSGFADVTFGFERPQYCSEENCPPNQLDSRVFTWDKVAVGDWDGNGTDTIGFSYIGQSSPYVDGSKEILLNLKNTISQKTKDASIQLNILNHAWSQICSGEGDWNGDGKTETGGFDPYERKFYMADSNDPYPSYNSFNVNISVLEGWDSSCWNHDYGGWQVVSGDWDGNGSITPGLYYQSWPFDDRGFHHAIPLVSRFYLFNSKTDNQSADVIFDFGYSSRDWYPVAGDFDGDGITTVGVYDSVNAVLHLKNDNSTSDAETTISYLSLETADGTISGVGRVPLAGDWNGKKSVSGHNIDTVGLSTSSGSVFYYKNTFISDSLPGNLVPQQMTQCQCLPYQCNENFQCVMGGGGPNCDPTNNGSECGQCDLSTFRCTTSVKSGVFCSKDSDCVFHCDAEFAKCDMTGGTGPACAGDADCSIKCDDASQKCIPGGTGKDCTLDSQCEVRCSSTTHKCEQGADGISCTKDSECGHLECPENKVCTFTTVPGDDKCSQVNAECCAPYSARNCNTCANQFCGTNGLWGICPATHEEPNTNGDCVCVIGPATGDPICNTPKTSASNLKASTEQCAEKLGLAQGQSAIFFSWNYTSNSTDFPVWKYTIQVAKKIEGKTVEDAFKHPVLSKTITIGTNGTGYSATQITVSFAPDVPDCEEDYWGSVKCYLQYGKAYYWRVQVIGGGATKKQIPSDWWYYNGTAGGTTTQTQATLYQMPYLPGPYVAVTYSPQNPKPKIEETVTFTDLSKCYSSTYVVGSPVPLCKTVLPDSSYTWTGATKTGIPGEATQTFSSAFAPSISLTICQPDGAPGTGQICCSASTPVSIDSNGDVNLPTWKETSPF